MEYLEDHVVPMDKKGSIWRLLPFAVVFLWCSSDLVAQTKDYTFRKLDMRDGLSFNSVMCLMEESNGGLWVGTREGLNRYDGFDFEVFRHNPYDSLSLSNSHINVVFESFDRQIWIGTANGLNLYNPLTKSFSAYLAPPDSSGLSNNYVKSIAEAVDKTLWIGTSNGLTIFDIKLDSFKHIFLAPPGTNPNNIISLFRDGEDLIWLGTRGGLYVWERGRFKRIFLDPEIENTGGTFEIRDIKQGTDGLYWVATEEHGIYSFRYSKGIFKPNNHWHAGNSPMLSNQVRQLFVEDQRIWLATLSGLCIYDLSEKSFTNIRYSIQKPDGINRGSIHDIIKDQYGGYWIATYSGGLNYYHPQNNLFEHHTQTAGVTDGLTENDVNGFLEDVDGNIWISTGRGLNHYHVSTGRFRYYGAENSGGLSNRIVKTMVADAHGNLWIGTYNGLNYYDTKKGTFKQFFHEAGRNSLNQNQVHALHMDEDGLLWIGMNMGEFQVYDPKKNRFDNVPEVGNIISYIYGDSKGRLWIGTRFGLKCLDRASRKLIDISGLLRGFEQRLLFVNWIVEDSRGRLWIGTQSSGLFLVKNNRLHWFGQGSGLASNTINALLEDEAGYFWISTNSGVSRLEYHEDEQGIPQVTSTDFSEIHGLQGAQFNPGSALRTKSGRIFLGGINGFNTFVPESIKKEIYFPKVHFNRLQINTKDAAAESDNRGHSFSGQDSVITLRYNQRNISIGFSGGNFVNPNGTYYRYSLSSLKHGWVEIGKQRSINFTYLPIGRHEVSVQASTDPAIWDDAYSSLTIVVLPPWWLTTGAYIIYALVLISSLYLSVMFFQRRAKRKNRLYLARVMREKEQKMLTSKLEFFTDISHELRTPLTLILTPLEKLVDQTGITDNISHQLSMIQRNGQKMMAMINQVLNLRRFESGQYGRLEAANDDLPAFLTEIALTFKPLATARDIRFDYAFFPESLETGFDSNKLEIVVHNLLSNAFKFAPKGGRVMIQMMSCSREEISGKRTAHSDDNFVKIVVGNSGSAIPDDVLQQIFNRFYTRGTVTMGNRDGVGIGLELTKRMVELHRGFMEVECNEGASEGGIVTIFTVFLPLGNVRKSDTLEMGGSDGLLQKSHLELMQRDEEAQLAAISQIELPNVSVGEKQTLLVVEDNDEVRALVKSLLADHYHVEEASDGHEGLVLALKVIPDLVISDIMMPTMDGIALCHRLKTDIRTSHIPVILLTARATIAYKHEGYETGADAYITKPFSSNYLLLRVKNLIKQREQVKVHLQREAFFDPGEVLVNTMDDNILRKAKDFVEQHLSDSTFTIEQMSRELGLSRMHFHRKIKSLTGLSPAEFVRNIRLKKGAAILKQNNISVKETMVMVGFENADHFRKCFKELFGVVPSDYQKHAE